MHTGKLFADGFDQQSRHNGAVYAAGKGKKHLFIADLGSEGFDLLCDKRFGKFFGGDTLHGFGSFVAVHIHSLR